MDSRGARVLGKGKKGWWDAGHGPVFEYFGFVPLQVPCPDVKPRSVTG